MCRQRTLGRVSAKNFGPCVGKNWAVCRHYIIPFGCMHWKRLYSGRYCVSCCAIWRIPACLRVSTGLPRPTKAYHGTINQWICLRGLYWWLSVISTEELYLCVGKNLLRVSATIIASNLSPIPSGPLGHAPLPCCAKLMFRFCQRNHSMHASSCVL